MEVDTDAARTFDDGAASLQAAQHSLVETRGQLQEVSTQLLRAQRRSKRLRELAAAEEAVVLGSEVDVDSLLRAGTDVERLLTMYN